MKNPFKFGTIVDDPYFINRKTEIKKVVAVLESDNHLIVSAPRRFGKSSLILKAVTSLRRPVISIDLQLITSAEDLAAQILKRVYRHYPAERLRQYIKQFRVIPTLSVNPLTNSIDVSFQPTVSRMALLEDVLNLTEKISTSKRKVIMIFDEFQEAARIHPEILQQIRAIIQLHKMVNYIFLGSQESLINEIFQKKKSPFYHFGLIIYLSKIPASEFKVYLTIGFKGVSKNPESIANTVLAITTGHPYYTQQLAFVVWEKLRVSGNETTAVADAVNELLRMHDMDYERIWFNFNKTDKKLLIGLSMSGVSPLSGEFSRMWDIGPTSTIFSCLKRLMGSGFVIKAENGYEIDDPFFQIWLKERRER
jgi:uncharacterized protein